MSVLSREKKTVCIRTAAWRAMQRRLPWLRLLGCAATAFLAARAPLFGALYPLGLCLAAAVSPGYALWAASGAAVGYASVLPATDAAPYFVAVCAVALLRLLGGSARYKDVPMAPACAGAVCLCLLRCGLGLAGGQGASIVLYAAAEGLLLLGAAYLLAAFFAAPHQAIQAQDAEAQAAVCLALMTGLACLTPLSILGLSAAGVAGALAALITAWKKGCAHAALVGVSVAIVLAAANPTNAYAGLGIAVGALAAGLFCPQGRALAAAMFCGGGFLGVLSAPGAAAGMRLMAELGAAALVFVLLPERWLMPWTPVAGTSAARTACITLAGRLETLSSALHNVGRTVQQICEYMPPKTETAADLCDAVAQQCCASCPKNTVCWVEYSTDTYAGFNHIAPLVRSAKTIGMADLPPILLRRCITPARLAACINTAAARQAARRGLVCTSNATRAALCEQYAALASTLSTLAGQVAMDELPEPRKTRHLTQLMRDVGLEPLDVQVFRSSAGRLHGTVLLPHVLFERGELVELAREASALCRQSLEVVCRQDGPYTTLLFAQRTRYRAVFGVARLPAQGNVSADAVQTFTHDGRAHAVLCDGMGTGKAAAVDGVMAAALAAQLLEAGFGHDETARLVNVALTLKSNDEAATTLDAATVDLFTGEAHLFKAGAAPCFLLHNGRISAHGATSVPIGILQRVVGDECSIALQENDTLLLVSDGALTAGHPWLCAQIALHGEKPAPDMAQAIAHAARAQSPRPDDITVITLRLKAAP